MEVIFSLKDGTSFLARDYGDIKKSRELLVGNISEIHWNCKDNRGVDLTHRCPGKNSPSYCFINKAIGFSNGKTEYHVGIGYSEDCEKYRIVFMCSNRTSYVEWRNKDQLDPLQIF